MNNFLKIIRKEYIYGFLLLILSFAIAHARFYNSDSAISSIIGQDLASGNILLKNWLLSTQPYFTTDYFWHGVIAFFIEDRYSAAIVGSMGIICFSWIAVFLLFKRMNIKSVYGTDLLFATFFIYTLAARNTFSNTPVHGATVAFSILAMSFFYKASRTMLSRLLFVLCAFLAVAGDNYALVYMVLPLVAEVCFKWFRHREFDRDIVLLALVLALAFIWAKLCRLYGYELPGIGFRFVAFSDFPHNIYLYFGGFFNEFSAWFWGRSLYSVKTFLTVIFAGIILLLFICHYDARHFSSRTSCFLVFSSLGVSCAFLFSNIPVDIHSGRYLIGIFYNGIFLTAMFLTKKLPEKINPSFRSVMICAMAVVSIGTAWFIPVNDQTKETQHLAAALQQRNLFHGYGEFWSSHGVALRGGRQMTIAPIISHGAGYAPYYWLTKKSWYTELPATFVVWDTSQPESASGMSGDRIANTFGVPQEKFSVGRYEVFSYDHALNDRLQGVRN